MGYATYTTRNGRTAKVSDFRWSRRFNGYLGYVALAGVRIEWAWLPDGRSIDPLDDAFDLPGFDILGRSSFREMTAADIGLQCPLRWAA